MKKTKLKKFVVPAIYTLTIFVFGTSMYLIQRVVNKNTFSTNEKMEYVDKEIVEENEYIPVINPTPTIMRPYLNTEVTINKTFYNYQDETKNQENSIIFYENTYIQNSGVSYTHKEVFDIVSILDGTVIDIIDNEILGKTIKIRHVNDLISTYQSLSEVNVNIDDQVLRGQIIGKSGNCSLYDNNSNLHFELYYQGQNVNPEQYYEKSQDEL